MMYKQATSCKLIMKKHVGESEVVTRKNIMKSKIWGEKDTRIEVKVLNSSMFSLKPFCICGMWFMVLFFFF